MFIDICQIIAALFIYLFALDQLACLILQTQAEIWISHFWFAVAFLFSRHLDRESKRRFCSEEEIKAW